MFFAKQFGVKTISAIDDKRLPELLEMAKEDDDMLVFPLYTEHGGDACEVCNGANGGVPGNESIVKGLVMCDYCHALSTKEKATH
jgi:hypothetical protein